jgi:hypothetical protein
VLGRCANGPWCLEMRVRTREHVRNEASRRFQIRPSPPTGTSRAVTCARIHHEILTYVKSSRRENFRRILWESLRPFPELRGEQFDGSGATLALQAKTGEVLAIVWSDRHRDNYRRRLHDSVVAELRRRLLLRLVVLYGSEGTAQIVRTSPMPAPASSACAKPT